MTTTAVDLNSSQAVAVLLALALPAGAAEVRELVIDKEKGVFRVHSLSYVDAPIGAVYNLLLDYDNFNRISPVFVENHYLEPEADGTLRVYTRAKGCITFFCMNIERVDRLYPEPQTRIVAKAVPELSDLEYGLGDWKLSKEGVGTLIDFRQEIDPDFWVPPLIGTWAIKYSLRKAGAQAVSRIEYFARQAAIIQVSDPIPDDAK